DGSRIPRRLYHTTDSQCSEKDRRRIRNRTSGFALSWFGWVLRRGERPVGRSVRSSKLARGYFVFGNLAAWVERAWRQSVRASPAGPMVRDEHGVRTDRLHHHGLQGDLASTRGHGHPISVLYLALLSETGMDFQPWIWILLEEAADTARLRA